MAGQSTYMIIEELNDLYHAIAEADGELTPELQAWWDEHHTVIAEKIDGITAFYRSREAGLKDVKAEKTRLTALGKTYEQSMETMKTLIDRLLTAMDVPKISGPTGGSWSRAGNGGKRPFAITQNALPALDPNAFAEVMSYVAPTPGHWRLDADKTQYLLDTHIAAACQRVYDDTPGTKAKKEEAASREQDCLWVLILAHYDEQRSADEKQSTPVRARLEIVRVEPAEIATWAAHLLNTPQQKWNVEGVKHIEIARSSPRGYSVRLSSPGSRSKEVASADTSVGA